jgi:hypothetical protein
MSSAPPGGGNYNSSGNSNSSSSSASYYQQRETFVDSNSQNQQINVKRSASSVNCSKSRLAPIAKPVRRSKSQRNAAQNFSIQHGGSVTLVSLNGSTDHSSVCSSDSEIKHVHHHHFVPLEQQQQQAWHQGPTQVSALAGSQTLPGRRGSKKVTLKPLASDDSDVVIKKQGLNGVKIQLNLNSIEEHSSVTKECQTSLDFDYDQHQVDQDQQQQDLTSLSKQKPKRKYTLEELEVEGFEPSESEEDLSAANSDKQSDLELEDDLLLEEEVDLNSLIEGDVDEDDDDMPTPLGKTKHVLIMY